MKKRFEPSTTWSPQYPAPQDAKVRLLDREFETYISDREPGIIVNDDCQLIDPACFWIDHEHVYVRLNWSTWGTISLSNSGQVTALCNAHHCHILLNANNDLSEYAAPVYRITELPKELFNDEADDDEKGDDGNTESQHDDSTNKSEFQQCVDRITEIVNNTSLNLNIFPRIQLGDYIASIVISDNNHALILDFLPENRAFLFIPSDKDNIQKQMDEWPTDAVSLGFIERLRSMKKSLEELDSEAIVDIGFLANSTSIDFLQVLTPSEDITDIKLFTYDNLDARIKTLFSDKPNDLKQSIPERVKTIIVEHMGVDASIVVEDANIIDDLGADEMDFVDLVLAFEEEFKCSIPDDAYFTIHTVKDMIEFIEKQI